MYIPFRSMPIFIVQRIDQLRDDDDVETLLQLSLGAAS